MRWVFCLNEAGSKTENLFYLKYAVLSAKKYTKLDPVCLFLGNNLYLEKFLKNLNIPIIKVLESPISNQLKYFHSSSPFWNLKTHDIIDFASGSFLRFEKASSAPIRENKRSNEATRASISAPGVALDK
jgi:hypothetical protein